MKFTSIDITFEQAEFINNLHKKKTLKSLNSRDLGKYVGYSQTRFKRISTISEELKIWLLSICGHLKYS